MSGKIGACLCSLLALVSDHLWVPFCPKDDRFFGLRVIQALITEQDVEFRLGSEGIRFKCTWPLHGRYGCSGRCPLPQLETSYEGDESVNILPTYQEVLFLIRVK